VDGEGEASTSKQKGAGARAGTGAGRLSNRDQAAPARETDQIQVARTERAVRAIALVVLAPGGLDDLCCLSRGNQGRSEHLSPDATDEKGE
jgi:hypothetical protein